MRGSRRYGSMAPPRKKQPNIKATDQSLAPSDASSSQPVVESTGVTSFLPPFQQSLLNIFKDALLLPASADTDLRAVIQEVKGHLYNRDFAKAFGSQQYLHAYALRWSASRTLAYADILAGLDVNIRSGSPNDRSTITHNEEIKPDQANILCIGGGSGAEVVALAAITRTSPASRLAVTVVDRADWSEVLLNLAAAITEPSNSSRHTHVSKSVAGEPFLSSARFHLEFKRYDVLECTDGQIRALVTDMSIVTIMFTMNEIFSESISSTVTFLFKLTEFMKSNSWLVVVDSPGSYSEVTLGKDGNAKRYPMKWLLDHTLLQMAGGDMSECNKWTKRTTNDSKWFRIEEAFDYPVELENMRYQVHVYQRHRNDSNPEE